MGRRLHLEAVLWIALAVFIGYRIWPQIAAAFGVDSGSAVAPSFHLTTLDGRSISSTTLRGKVVLVNFWATWCLPCRVEMPEFQSLYVRKKAEGFVVLGISTDATGPAEVTRFLVAHGITYPVGMASAELAQRFGGVNLLPTSFLIGRDGRIRSEVRGIFVPIALDRAVDRLLKEPAHLSGFTPVAATAAPR